MKKFKFKLAALLNIRSVEEKKSTQEYVAVLGIVNKQRKIIREATKSKQEQNQNLQQSLSLVAENQANRTQYFIQFFQEHTKAMDYKITQANIVLSSTTKELKEKEAKMLEAKKKKKSLELLEERQSKEYQLILKRSQKKILEKTNRLNQSSLDQEKKLLQEVQINRS